MDQQVQKDLVEKKSHPTQMIGFLRRKMAFVHRFQKDPFGWLILLMGPIILWPKRKILRWWWPILKDGIGQFGLIYDVMRDHLFLRGVENSLYRNEVELTPCGPTSGKLSDCFKCRHAWEKWLGHGRSWHGFSLAFGFTVVPVLVFQKSSGGILALF